MPLPQVTLVTVSGVAVRKNVTRTLDDRDKGIRINDVRVNVRARTVW